MTKAERLGIESRIISNYFELDTLRPYDNLADVDSLIGLVEAKGYDYTLISSNRSTSKTLVAYFQEQALPYRQSVYSKNAKNKLDLNYKLILKFIEDDNRTEEPTD